MESPFDGTWMNLKCTADIEGLLGGATLHIKGDVTWTIQGKAVTSTPTYEGSKMWGEFTFENHDYYYEIAYRQPPVSMTEPKHYIYGTVSKMMHRGGGDLGDPGAWRAEELGPETGS